MAQTVGGEPITTAQRHVMRRAVSGLPIEDLSGREKHTVKVLAERGLATAEGREVVLTAKGRDIASRFRAEGGARPVTRNGNGKAPAPARTASTAPMSAPKANGKTAAKVAAPAWYKDALAYVEARHADELRQLAALAGLRS